MQNNFYDAGTHDIQNVSVNSSHVTISFVNNTIAMGAFIIFNQSSSENNSCSYDYIPAQRKEDSILILELLTEDVQFQRVSTILAYDIESNGLLKNTTLLRPSFLLQVDELQPCIVTCDSNSSSTPLTSKLTVSSIVFVLTKYMFYTLLHSY